MTTYVTRTTRIVVAPVGEPPCSEEATTVSIEDEAGGEYVTVEQSTNAGAMIVSIDPTEWPAIRRAIDRMVKECRE